MKFHRFAKEEAVGILAVRGSEIIFARRDQVEYENGVFRLLQWGLKRPVHDLRIEGYVIWDDQPCIITPSSHSIIEVDVVPKWVERRYADWELDWNNREKQSYEVPPTPPKPPRKRWGIF